jgi:RNA polymerase sigma factor (TIGR02999 family)
MPTEGHTVDSDREGEMCDVTRILMAIEQGDARAVDQLLPAVYQELRQLAAQKLSRETPGQTLQATALVHEAYLKLVRAQGHEWRGRTHFFAASAEAMRRILIDNARRKKRLKRGGAQGRISLDEAQAAIEAPSDDVIAVNEALERFAETDQEKAELVKLRYFAGLTLDQAADVMGISRTTAKRHWTYAKAWLYRSVTSEK